MKKTLLILFVIIAILIFAGCGGTNSGVSEESGTSSNQSTGTKVIQIGFTTSATVADDPYNVFASTFAKLVNERSKGSIKAEALGGGQLGQELEMFDGMKIGTIDAGIITNAYVGQYAPANKLFDLPFLFKDNAQAASILDGSVGTSVLNAVGSSNLGVTALAWGEGGFRHLVTKVKAVHIPSDMGGLKIRSMETKAYLDTYAALGVNAVPMAWAETIPALQQGTIEGLDIPISVIYANGFAKIADYLNLTGHFYSPLVLCMSDSVYNNLTAEEKEIVKQAAVEAGQATRDNNARVEKTMLAEMAEQGMTIVSDVDIDSFRNKLSSFYEGQKKNIGGTYVDDLFAELDKLK
ncbi:MAG: TRAP transporter substrate-binding protein DctP [Peptococcaceae bacterium]